MGGQAIDYQLPVLSSTGELHKMCSIHVRTEFPDLCPLLFMILPWVAGVSKSTVSRVLNKQTNISPEAREKVLRAIEELQYQPNKLAPRADLFGFLMPLW